MGREGSDRRGNELKIRLDMLNYLMGRETEKSGRSGYRKLFERDC